MSNKTKDKSFLKEYSTKTIKEYLKTFELKSIKEIDKNNFIHYNR